MHSLIACFFSFNMRTASFKTELKMCLIGNSKFFLTIACITMGIDYAHVYVHVLLTSLFFLTTLLLALHF